MHLRERGWGGGRVAVWLGDDRGRGGGINMISMDGTCSVTRPV